MNDETILISKFTIIKWADELKKMPDDYQVCPSCGRFYDGKYEACKCRRLLH